MGILSQLWPINEVLPTRPKIAERTTGQVMGEAADDMGKRNEISRAAQDEFAVRSHHRAAAAIAAGRFDDEVAPIDIPGGGRVHADGLVRADTSVEKLAKLRPVFHADGNVTAGNASPLTDGAAAVLLMTEEKAKALGLTPLAALRSWGYVGVDPADQLLMGPALAMPKALDKAGMKLSDIDYVDMHEAFAAQVLSVLKMLGSKAFAKSRLGRDEAVGDVDDIFAGAHGHDHGQRARPLRQGDRPHRHLRRRRARRRRRPRTRVSGCPYGRPAAAVISNPHGRVSSRRRSP